MNKFKQKVFKIISVDNENYLPSRIFDILIIVFVILSVFLSVLDTFSDLPQGVFILFRVSEGLVAAVFTIEYVLGFWTADCAYPGVATWRARVRYVRSFMAIVGFLALMPFYLPLFVTVDLRILLVFRLLRLLRTIKIAKYTSDLNTVFKRKKAQLVSSVLVVIVFILVISVIMYDIEYTAQPEVFENAFSGLWWAVSTLTTVGYGDIYPVTVAGKALGAIISMLGIGLIAIPTGILSAGFVEQNRTDDRSEPMSYCPHCGKKLSD